jgi:rhodanese-related sulfurtransferase
VEVFESIAAKLRLGQSKPLHHGSHGAIQNHDSALEDAGQLGATRVVFHWKCARFKELVGFEPTDFRILTMQHLLPTQAWELIQSAHDAVFIDVRMEVESLYVGRPPGVINIPWYEYPHFEANKSEFVAATEKEVAHKGQPVVLICRSGARTLDAGNALEEAGFTNVINVLHGFEGELDAQDHRSKVNGWRFEGLPWEQM